MPINSNLHDCQSAEVKEIHNHNNGDYRLLSKLLESQKNELAFLHKQIENKTNRISELTKQVKSMERHIFKLVNTMLLNKKE